MVLAVSPAMVLAMDEMQSALAMVPAKVIAMDL